MKSDGGDGDPKLKMPISISIPTTEEKASMGGLKSYTAYCVQVSDFGKTFTIERRFDDFQKLHCDLAAVDPGLPALPEKKMFASTDAAVVAERKPAFERLLRYLMKSEEAVFDTGQALWKFLELPATAMVAVRYLHKSKRLSYVKQCGKLLDSKYEKEHAYRLCHESLLRTNLFLLTEEGEASLKSQAEGGGAGKEADADTEGAILEMVRYAVAQGGEETRKRFLSEGGLRNMLTLLRRNAEREGASPTPDQRVRNVLNALIHAEGENYPRVFAQFLREGGVATLVGFQDLCTGHATFAEFIGKALWLAWEPETQAAFLEAAGTTFSEALKMLSAFFGSSTRSGRIMAGLLLATIIANDLFASDREREAKAAQGVSQLVEDLLVTLPPASSVAAAPGGPAATKPKEVCGEDVQAAEAFLGSVGRNERGFARILACAAAPARSVMEFNEVPPEGAAVWSACAFALWCLLKVQPKATRIASLRPFLPTLAKAGPSRVRWLAGELLLQLHVAPGATGAAGGGAASPAAEGGSGTAAAGASGTLQELGAEATAKEQTVLEAAMSEQISHTSDSLQSSQEENRRLLVQQQQLAEVRQQELAIAAGGGWTSGLDAALKKLASVREQLSGISASAREKEERSTESLTSLARAIELDATASVSDVQNALVNVHEVETVYREKAAECDQLEAALKEQSESVERCRVAMDEADGAVVAARKRISEMEAELTGKQKQAQYQRTMAATDSSSHKDKIAGDVEQIDKKLGQMREKAQKFQAGEALPDGTPAPDASQLPEVMSQLRAQASQLKQKKAELQAELQKWQRLADDPESAQAAAADLEREASELQEQLTSLRTGELSELERQHGERREAWQMETAQLSRVRSARDSSAREKGDLERQVSERWQRWRPLWSARLSRWHERAAALSDAQVRCRGLEDVVTSGWDLLREEDEARREVLAAIGQAQADLAQLAQQVASVGDLG